MYLPLHTIGLPPKQVDVFHVERTLQEIQSNNHNVQESLANQAPPLFGTKLGGATAEKSKFWQRQRKDHGHWRDSPGQDVK